MEIVAGAAVVVGDPVNGVSGFSAALNYYKDMFLKHWANNI